MLMRDMDSDTESEEDDSDSELEGESADPVQADSGMYIFYSFFGEGRGEKWENGGLKSGRIIRSDAILVLIL